MAAAHPVLATCQCDVIPENPCGAAITQEDLLCDNCRAARGDGMLHVVTSLFTGPVVTSSRHAVLDARETYWGSAPEGS